MRKIKGVGIVGFKNSGKTTLIKKLTETLKTIDNYRITVIKHSSSPMELDETKDSEKLFKFSDNVIGLFKDAELNLKKDKTSYNDIVRTLDTDILIVEGFKSVKNLPKLICINEIEDIEKLSDGLEIGYFSLKPIKDSKVKIWSLDDINEIAENILERGFLLPNINCGKCNERTCYEFGLKLINKKVDIYKCSYIKDKEPISITINNEEVVLNKFTGDALKNIISAYLNTLKGIGKGPVEIKFELE